MRRQQTLLESAKRYKSGRGLHYQSLRFCLQSLNFLHRGELKKKKGKEGREDKGGAACCISIPPAERLSVCLWQQPREGDTLCILTQLVYLSLCHCLSLALSVSACLSLAMSVCYISASTLPLPVTVFLHSGQFFFLRSLLASPYHSVSRCHLYVYLASPRKFSISGPPPSLPSSPYFHLRPCVPPKQSPLEIILFAPEQNRTTLSRDGQEVCREATHRVTMMLAAMRLHLR